ncbi:MAG: hypothetical protein EXR99_12245 [Gemmataceae bacterium]|nr:hypothetical protein [Gemmataceae bacterium]
MEKGLCWSAMGAAGIVSLLFILDLAIQIPFGRSNLLVDVFALVCSVLVLLLAWDAFRDLA